MRGRRRSTYRYRSRTDSSISARSSTGNGGGSASARTSTAQSVELDLTGGQLGVLRALGAPPHRALDPQHPLAAHVDRPVDHALDGAAVVAQVDERQVLPVLAAPAHPAAQRHRRLDVLGSELAAQMGAHPRGGGHWSSFVVRGRRHASASHSTTDARGTASWAPSWRSGLAVTICAASSSAPTISAYRAPERSACLSWALSERPS